MGKTLVSLDVGVTTGYAVYDVSSRALLEHGNFGLGSLRESLSALRDQHRCSYSVAEFPVPQGGVLGDQLSAAITYTRIVFDRQLDEVRPSQWKQHPAGKVKCPRGLTPHERDAIRIGNWYMAIKLQGGR